MKLRPESLRILANERTAPGHFRMRLESRRIAREAHPGQFVQILVGQSQDPLLPRPFSFLETGSNWFDILYQVVGRGTGILSKQSKGDVLEVLGPLGCGWRAVQSEVFVLVGGGVGIPPLYHWAKELILKKKIAAGRVRVFLGGRSREFLHHKREFARLGVRPVVATEDGSEGVKGFVTRPLEDFLKAPSKASISARPVRPIGVSGSGKVQIYTCGPTPMLKAVSALAAKYAAGCQVSVEEPMPCGFGVCLGCAIKVSDGCGGHRFALSCSEGPVFDAAEVMWS